MAVTEHKRGLAQGMLVRLLSLLLIVAGSVAADDDSSARHQLAAIGTALATGDTAQAMLPFSKNYAQYQELLNDFSGLIDSYQISSEVTVENETSGSGRIDVTARWDLTLQDRGTAYTKNRSAEISIRLTKKGRQWKIIEFSPIKIFQP
jgi:hypothetical protein